MSFTSQTFVVFLFAVLAVYWALPWKRARVYILLAAGLYFYGSWDWRLALLVAGSSTVDWIIGRLMGVTETPWKRRLLLLTSIVGNVGILAYFRYADFFLRSLETSLQAAGWQAAFPTLQVIAPIGISFYTFEAISYTVDVYQRKVPPAKNLADFMLFILFFPHLVSGPIMRAGDFLPQVQRTHRINWERWHVGLQFIIMGVFKKLAIADRMAEMSDPVFADPSLYKTRALWEAAFAYSLRVYCDFSGYSDMAVGLAHLFGYKLSNNFNMPYLAADVSQFWRRWHISLSQWLRDYIFIPLGGSRGAQWKTCLILMATMVIGGLWHGPAWTFILWGAYHGLLLVMHRLTVAFAETRPTLKWVLATWPAIAVSWALTFFAVMMGWILFRCQTLDTAKIFIGRMFRNAEGDKLPVHEAALGYTAAVVIVAHIVGALGIWTWIARKAPAPVLGIGYALVFTAALVLAPATEKVFIYFQF